MKRSYLPKSVGLPHFLAPSAALCVTILATMPLAAQNQSPSPANTSADNQTPTATFKISGKAVLLDVVVTDKNGNPVTGLKQEAFSVLEKGKPQAISFFEEHKADEDVKPVELPTLPMNVFTNFTPIQPPAAVNVLLLDSLNTPIEDQAYVHKQAIKFLKSLKPGSRMAIFTMGLGLRFVQGFSDDPAILMAALGNKKSSEMQDTMLIEGQQETLAQQTSLGQMAEVMPAGPGGTVTAGTQAMIDALAGFFDRTEQMQTDDRAYRTLENLQHLSRFLGSFPGRKNLIWFSETFPVTFVGMSTAQFNGTDTRTETRFEDTLKKTIDLLTTARIAVYPVDARGAATNSFYQAQSQLNSLVTTTAQVTGETASQQTVAPSVTGVSSAQVTLTTNEDAQRNTDQETMKQLAHDSGGKAFVNTNGLAEVMADVVKSSADFYTITYSPENKDMNGQFRPIEVKVNGAKYNLSYRRGYYALDQDLPGAGNSETTAVDPSKMTNPLAPVMDFGMPQSEQILYKTMIQPLPQQQEAAATTDAKPMEKPVAKGPTSRYMVNFAIDLGDVRLKEEADGLHTGRLVISMIVYDRYGNIVTRKDHIAALNIKPEIYKIIEKAGIQLRDWVEVPRGQYWLRTGVYDPATRKVGTLEVPLSAVKTVDTAAVH
jgi:VWFA-related protein